MAGQGIKNFTAEVHTSANVDGYLMQQTIPVFASTSARDSEFTSASVTPASGMFCTTTDTGSVFRHDGTSWVTYSSPPIDYVPTWNNFTVGSATVVAAYAWLPGKVLHVWGQCTLAGDSSVTGDIQQIIPLSQTATAKGATGTSLQNDAGTQIYLGIVHVSPSQTAMDFHHSETGNGGVTNATAPFTWTTSDVFTWDIQIQVT